MVYMILIIDNGKGAREVSAFLRVKNSVVKPNQITAKAAGYVISDGKLSKDSQKIIADLLKKTDKPVLGMLSMNDIVLAAGPSGSTVSSDEVLAAMQVICAHARLAGARAAA